MTDHAFVSANAISRAVNVGWVLLASTTAIIGALCLITGDFAYSWQPVPENLPQRALLARLTGLLFIAVGLLCFLPRLRNFGINALVVIFWAWLLVFLFLRYLKMDGWARRNFCCRRQRILHFYGCDRMAAHGFSTVKLLFLRASALASA